MMVYALTKAMITGYDAFKDGAPGAAGLKVDRQNASVGDAGARGRRESDEGGRRSGATRTRPTTPHLRKRQEVLKRERGTPS